MKTLRYRLNEKYRELVRRFIDALTNNRSAKELERITLEIKETIMLLNKTGG